VYLFSFTDGSAQSKKKHDIGGKAGSFKLGSLSYFCTSLFSWDPFCKSCIKVLGIFALGPLKLTTDSPLSERTPKLDVDDEPVAANWTKCRQLDDEEWKFFRRQCSPVCESFPGNILAEKFACKEREFLTRFTGTYVCIVEVPCSMYPQVEVPCKQERSVKRCLPYKMKETYISETTIRRIKSIFHGRQILFFRLFLRTVRSFRFSFCIVICVWW
jgi:hypothetical protein